MFFAVLAITGVVTAVILVLREQVLSLVMRLRMLASHDSLTGALNRGALEQSLESEIARAGRTSTSLALVVFDVDHFKSINDR
jgi:GGDEF domain-containing protein